MSDEQEPTILKVGARKTFGPTIGGLSGEISFTHVVDPDYFVILEEKTQQIDHLLFKYELTVQAKNLGECSIAVQMTRDGKALGSADYPFRIVAD